MSKDAIAILSDDPEVSSALFKFLAEFKRKNPCEGHTTLFIANGPRSRSESICEAVQEFFSEELKLGEDTHA